MRQRIAAALAAFVAAACATPSPDVCDDALLNWWERHDCMHVHWVRQAARGS